mmetsp:Transcript_42944/g.119659  ORF Transcript_42944/g.119659 Transcript_42944/m.119659 type:complete len:289 (+) Transcript_42944:945-1811(+)
MSVLEGRGGDGVRAALLARAHLQEGAQVHLRGWHEQLHELPEAQTHTLSREPMQSISVPQQGLERRPVRGVVGECRQPLRVRLRGHEAKIAVELERHANGAWRRERLLHGLVDARGARERQAALQLVGDAEPRGEPLDGVGRIARQHLQVVCGLPVQRGVLPDVQVDVLRGLPGRGISHLADLGARGDGREESAEVPLAEHVRAAHLHQRVDWQILGRLPDLRAQLQLLERRFGRLQSLGDLLGNLGDLGPQSRLQGGPQAGVLPLLPVLLDVLVVIAHPYLEDAGGA